MKMFLTILKCVKRVKGGIALLSLISLCLAIIPALLCIGIRTTYVLYQCLCTINYTRDAAVSPLLIVSAMCAAMPFVFAMWVSHMLYTNLMELGRMTICEYYLYVQQHDDLNKTQPATRQSWKTWILPNHTTND